VGGYEENVEITFSVLGRRVEFKTFSDVPGGHADSLFGVREFEDVLAKYYILSNVDLCKDIQSVSQKKSRQEYKLHIYLEKERYFWHDS
jgi:hypothetical protein